MQGFTAFIAAVIAFIGSVLHVGPALAIGTPAEATSSASYSIIFGGDMMFDRTIRTAAIQSGGDYLFSCLDSTLASADTVVANLEGPITANDSRSVGSVVGSSNNYVFTFPLSTAVLLARHHIGAVNLGNNHIENFGEDGVRSTEIALDAAGVRWFGDPIEQRTAVLEHHGITIALINYNEFEGASTPERTVQQIAAARERAEIPVVYAHWGVEYQPATEREQALAHEFVDAGAEIVIGSHPHVTQEQEVYRGKYIYYSLGNMIFDQYWNESVRDGLLVAVTFTPTGVAATRDIPVELKRDRTTCPRASS